MQLFMSNPNRSFYVREITRKIDEQINSVRRELANLLSIGIITSDTNNNRLYYEVNQKFKFYKPLQEIFGGKNVTGSQKNLVDESEKDNELKILGHVELALYTGQFTRDDSSGVDFLVVGDVNPNQLVRFVADLEATEGKEIRYTVMPLEEFIYRRQINDRFLNEVLDSKYQLLVDKSNLLSHNKIDKQKKKEK